MIMDQQRTGGLRNLKPRPIGIVVAVAGLISSLMLGAFLLSPLPMVPLVIVWACVYGYVPGARDRWPWWVLGQWVSLTAMQLTRLLIEGLGWASVWISPVVSGIVTFVWMVLVGLYLVQQRSWRTRRPGDSFQSSTAVHDIE